MKVVVAAGGTGGHIFPALSVILEMRKQVPHSSFLWIGTKRSREEELCEKYDIPLKMLSMTGMNRLLSASLMFSFVKFVMACWTMLMTFRKDKPDVVIAFGGYVCAPVLVAARFFRIPYYLQEQNSVPGLVNRMFEKKAQCTFLGYPIEGKWKLKGKTLLTQTPVRDVMDNIRRFQYPDNFRKDRVTILISGGSQGAKSMNDYLVRPLKNILSEFRDIQVVWQTGDYSFDEITEAMEDFEENLFIYKSIDDLYPFYAVSHLVVSRAGASTLNEISYFGLPTIMIPLPWASENHQWINGEVVENSGWGIRVRQNAECEPEIENALKKLLTDKKLYDEMCQRSIEHSPVDAAKKIVASIIEGSKK